MPICLAHLGASKSAGRSTEHDPVRDSSTLHCRECPRVGEEADVGLSGIVPIHHAGRPAAKIGRCFELGATKREIVLVDTEPRCECEHGVRLIGGPRDVVGGRLVQAAVQPGIGQSAQRERIGPIELIRLTEQSVPSRGAQARPRVKVQIGLSENLLP